MTKKSYKRNCEVTPAIAVPEGMSRIALGIEYLGATFNGFQKQASTANTVQASLERALSKVADEAITLVCAGRTDAGVSATGQVVHFDTLARRPQKAWLQGVNTHLPDQIRVLWADAVPMHFHARFSALARTYRYVIHTSPVRSALFSQQCTWTSHALDAELMQQGADCLLGEHDFSAFRAAQCQAHSPVRRVDLADIRRHQGLIVFEVRANAFLHHMVRNMVGSLLEVGKKNRSPGWIAELLAGRDRTLAAATAPPFGLYLIEVEYPPEFALPRHGRSRLLHA